jgi:hypothetical protein
MANALAKLSRVHTMLAEARTFQDFKKIRDMAEAARAYIKAAKLGRDAQYEAAEIALLAAHKAGTILRKLPKAKPKAKGGRASDSEYWKTLNGSNVPYRTAQRWQQIASVPEEALAKYAAAVRKADRGEISAVGLLRAIKPKVPKPKSRFTRRFVIPLTDDEFYVIRQWASRSFYTSGVLTAEQRFIRECLNEFFKETGMALPLEQTETIQKRLLKWLAQKPISESPLFREVMQESGVPESEIQEHLRQKQEEHERMEEAASKDPLS